MAGIKNKNIVVKILKELISINDSMENVKKITKISQLIIYNKKFDFDILCQLETIFRNLDIRYNSRINCLSVEMENCRIKLIRKE